MATKKKITPVKEKKEIKTAVPVFRDGFVYTVMLQDYGDYRKGEEVMLVERRYKSLKKDNIVK